MVWHNRVHNFIQKRDINENLLTFLNNFFSNREIQVKAHNNISNWYPTEKSLPQGSVLRVTLPYMTYFSKFKNPLNTSFFLMITTSTEVATTLIPPCKSFKKHFIICKIGPINQDSFFP